MGASAPTFTSSIYIYTHVLFLFWDSTKDLTTFVPSLLEVCMGDILRYADVGRVIGEIV